MSGLVKINKDDNIKLNSKVMEYLNPDYVYIPFSKKVSICINDYIYKNQIITTDDNKITFSPVSGLFVGYKTCLDCFGNKRHCIVIANDFKEKLMKKTGSKKRINTLEKSVAMEFLKSFNIFDSNLLSDLKNCSNRTLIVNGIDSEPYFGNKVFYLKNYTLEILETMAALKEIFGFKDVCFAILDNDGSIIKKCVNFLGSYPEVKLRLLADLYPVGNLKVLKKALNLTNKDIVINTEDLYAIYNVFKKGKPVVEKYITVSGHGLKKPQIVNVKQGVLVKELINKFDIKKGNYYAYVNGLMNGIRMNLDDLVITNDFKGIIIDEYNMLDELPCINCGTCSNVCPMKVNVKGVMDENKLDNNKDKCINCGLCSYVCPSHIQLNKYLEKR